MEAQKVLKIYLSNTDKVEKTSVYETLAFKAQEYKLAGTTVYRGIMGFGSSCDLRTDKFWTFTEKMPIVIEIIDSEENINKYLDAVLPIINEIPKGCLITLEDVKIILRKKGKK